MNKMKLTFVAALASCFGAPVGFRTANAGEPDFQKQIAEQAKHIEALEKQIANATAQAGKIAALEKQLASHSSQAGKIAELELQLAMAGDQSARIAALEKRLSASEEAAEETNTPLLMMCKGAGVDPGDVRWRVQAGLDLDQAVAAAIAQQKHDEAAD